MTDNRKEEMAAVNRGQTEFYSQKPKVNLVHRIWRYGRGAIGRYMTALGIKPQYYSLHRTWLGDLANADVLDLGCFSGNALSVHLAEHANSYLGLDLSAPAIQKLSSKIKHIPTARAEAADFLALDPGRKFDVIYAYAVLHHFKYPDVLIDHLKRHLRPGGRVIAYDPLETYWPMFIARRLYRPFQADADWEWPFSRPTVKLFCREFEVLDMRGILGRSRVGLLFWPFSKRLGRRVGRRGHARDFRHRVKPDGSLYRCLHLTMHLRLPGSSDDSDRTNDS